VFRTRWGTVDDKGNATFCSDLETREVSIDKKYQDEVFAVDFKRPAAGSLKYTAGFDGQYINSIANQLDDRTIKDSAALVAAIIKTIPASSLKDASPSGDNMTWFQDVIATEVFAINEPDIENRIQSFLGTYINQCHKPCDTPCAFTAPTPGCQPACIGCQKR
jgi:hypothetical protein